MFAIDRFQEIQLAALLLPGVRAIVNVLDQFGLGICLDSWCCVSAHLILGSNSIGNSRAERGPAYQTFSAIQHEERGLMI